MSGNSQLPFANGLNCLDAEVVGRLSWAKRAWAVIKKKQPSSNFLAFMFCRFNVERKIVAQRLVAGRRLVGIEQVCEGSRRFLKKLQIFLNRAKVKSQKIKEVFMAS